MDKMIILSVERPLSESLAKTAVSARGKGKFSGSRPINRSLVGEKSEILAGMTMEVAELNEKEQADTVNDPNVAAAALAMPLKLIKPAKRSAVRVEPVEMTDGTSAKPTWGIEAIGATSESYTGIGAKVAVLDTGIDVEHAAFEGIDIGEDYNYFDFTGEGFDDDDGHGTHCAGTIFGRDVDGHRIGVAKGVSDVLIGKVLGKDGSDTSALMDGLDWALKQGANVISMSLGYDVPGLIEKIIKRTGLERQAAFGYGLSVFQQNLYVFDTWMKMMEARREAQNEATIVVAASGNESKAECNPLHRLPASLPAASQGVFSVGALKQGKDGRLAVAGFSNGNVDFAAPGVDVLSANSGGGLVAFDGTSMATPHVAGVIARLFQKHSKLKGAALVRRVLAELEITATTDLTDADNLKDCGSGLVQSP